MGRGGRSSGRSAPAPRRAAPPPATRAAAPPPAKAGAQAAPAQSTGGGFLSTMVQGFAFGTGSSIAREAVGSVMGGRGEQAPAPEQQPAPQQQQFGASQSAGVCAIDNEQLMSCLRANSSNAGACDFYFTALQQCQAREGS